MRFSKIIKRFSILQITYEFTQNDDYLVVGKVKRPHTRPNVLNSIPEYGVVYMHCQGVLHLGKTVMQCFQIFNGCLT